MTGRDSRAAAEVAWERPEARRRREARLARRRGLVRALITALVAAALVRTGHPVAAAVLAGLAVATAALALAAPGRPAVFGRLEAALGRGLGTALSLLLLAPLLYLVLTPARLVGLGRPDPLRRKRDPDASTYFRPHRDRPLDRPY